MKFDPTLYHYPSRRNVMYAEKGMVATSTPLAAQAGIAILRKGGNAIDAAIATAACLTVVEPTSNGIGGDAFALVWVKDKLYGLNASGPSPQNMPSAKELRDQGHKEMPVYGWTPVTVPGAPSSWAALSERFGKLPLTEVLQPAIEYARNGYPLSVNTGRLWKRAFNNYKKKLTDDVFKHWFEHFTIDGRCPEIGEKWGSEATAKTLESIAQTNVESFYRGELAEKIDDFSRKTGGYLRKEDLAAYKPEWVEPIKVNYRGYDVWEIPPNGHGISVLMALNILKGFDLATPGRERIDTYHTQLEAMKLAFLDAKRYVTDPAHMSVTVEQLLSDAYADERRKLIGKEAIMPEYGNPAKGGTVYLCAADGEGNMISFIQSNYMGFGSGLVVPGTGIALHNRGNNFELEEGHDNILAPGKRPYNTIIPGFMSKDGKPVGPFGVMGGFMQPQGHVQVVCNTVDFGMNPQDCLDAPRWQWVGGKRVDIEHGVPLPIIQELVKRGHEINVCSDYILMGRGEIIWKMDNGMLCGASEPRTDGTVAIY